MYILEKCNKLWKKGEGIPLRMERFKSMTTLSPCFIQYKFHSGDKMVNNS